MGSRSLIITQGDPEGVGPELLCALAAAGVLQSGDEVVAARAPLDRVASARSTPTGLRPGGLHWRPTVTHPPEADPERFGQYAALVHGVDRALSDPDSLCLGDRSDRKEDRTERGPRASRPYRVPRGASGHRGLRHGHARPHLARGVGHHPSAPVRRSGRVDPRRHRALGRPTLAGPERGLRTRASTRSPFWDSTPTRVRAGCSVARTSTSSRRRSRRCKPRTPRPASPVRCPPTPPFPSTPAATTTACWPCITTKVLGPFKLMHFDDGVNRTLGLPFVRTSPDHGTAKDIAFTGKVNPASMLAAVKDGPRPGLRHDAAAPRLRRRFHSV